MQLLKLIFKNVFRNATRTILTGLGVSVLVLIVTMIWSVLNVIDRATSEKAANLKGIVTEAWQVPSQMPFTYAAELTRGAAAKDGDYVVPPDDSMTWQFYGGALQQLKRGERPNFENIVFAFALEPKCLRTMMDELADLPKDSADAKLLEEGIAKMNTNKQGIIIGQERLNRINKRVGDRIKIYSINYKEIDLEFEIVGVFPRGRYDNSAAMNRQYLLDALDAYPSSHNGKRHPLAERTLALVWLRMPDRSTFDQVSKQILGSPLFKSPQVKIETASSGVASFIEPYKDLLWGVRWLLAPAILVTLAVITANAISISVRERRKEMAVLKVLGFRPREILLLVLGEALLVGLIAGLISIGLSWYFINIRLGGLSFPIAFFSKFYVEPEVMAWALAAAVLTSFAGSVFPALSASSVKVVDVFSKVT